MAYDPALNLIYVGTGNGGPWNRFIRSPGGGDNLYLSSILALNPDTGRMAWYYQTTPGDSWDYNATQHIILADVRIRGAMRQVLMQAPKNGFFYMLDRKTGELISAEKYVEVTWATGIDMQTGRPKEKEGADYIRQPFLARPAPLGGHNWQPMSYSPKTGLVYIPAQDNAREYSQPDNFEFRPNQINLAAGNGGIDHAGDSSKPVYTGRLLAWDPVAQQVRWKVEYPAYWNGGTLATAGNLVFQGTAAGDFIAYRATDGAKLWSAWMGTGTLAAPIAYEIDGQQYVSVMAGWGGAFVPRYRSKGLLYTFALNGSEPAPVRPAPDHHGRADRFPGDGRRDCQRRHLVRGAMRALPQRRHHRARSAPPGACDLRRAAEHPAEGRARGTRHAAIPHYRRRSRRAARVPPRRAAEATLNCLGSPTISAP